MPTKHFLNIILFVLPLVIVTNLSAQTTQPTYLGAQGTTAFQTSKLKLDNNAVAIDPYTVQLTAAVNRQAGSAELPPICGKEYKVTFDLNAGNDLSGSGGAGFYIFRTRENRHESEGTWGESFPAKKTAAGLQNRLDLLHFDTWRDWTTVNGQTVYQRDGNSVYYWSADGGHQDVLGINASLNESMPFNMEGSGWFNVTMYFKGKVLVVEVRRSGSLVLSRTLESFYEERVPHYLIVSAWTGASQNVQSVKNLTFQGIVPDDCAPLLTDAQLTTELTKSCGAFNQGVCPETCVKSSALSLFLQGKLDISVYETAVRACQNSVCIASNTDSYNRGFSAGVASVNTATIKAQSYQQGYNAGVASIDLVALKAAANKLGYDSGYAKGFTDGANSRASEVTDAYSKGAISCEASAVSRENAAYLKGLLTTKVTICHNEPKKNPVTITISTSALATHINQHGDTIGACPIAPKSAIKGPL